MKIVSVVLGTHNRLSFLRIALESIRAELKSFSHEIIIIDGGSSDGTIDWLTKQKDVITIVQHNRGEWKGQKIKQRSWGYFMNLGFKCAQGKYVCMLSDDCLVVPGAIKNGIDLFEKRLSDGKKVGAVAFYWRNWPEQKKYWVGITIGNKIFVNHGLFLNNALKEVGYIDEDNYHFYFADGDLSLKLWEKKFEILDCPKSYIEHYAYTHRKISRSREEKFYLKKWQNIFKDPKTSDWITREFSDRYKTANKFLSATKRKTIFDKFKKVISI